MDLPAPDAPTYDRPVVDESSTRCDGVSSQENVESSLQGITASRRALLLKLSTVEIAAEEKSVLFLTRKDH